KVKDKQAREAFTNIIKAYESMIGYYAFVKKDLTIETEDPNLATAIDKQYALSVQYITKTTNMSKRW
ncbi:MAG: hypothetical protein RR838_10040, partial [Clostridium sp.]